MVLIRPPSLEPSTPDVREPRAWDTRLRVIGCPHPALRAGLPKVGR